MKNCRVCGSDLTELIIHQAAPTVTSVKSLANTDMELLHCVACNHVQAFNSINVNEFYDSNYEISLETEEHDQLHQDKAGNYVERTKLQAQIMLELVDMFENMTVLDFGAGKASTLKHLQNMSPIVPFVYDVSDSYTKTWMKWIPESNQATFNLPDNWKSKFDLISMHYVMEHVEQPVEILKYLSNFLNENGLIYFTVPNFKNNIGDIFVVDHLNKFTSESIDKLCELSGLELVGLSLDALDGAICCTLAKGNEIQSSTPIARKQILETNKFLRENTEILAKLKERDYGEKIAVFGAGFYGTLLASVRGQSITCFIDNNPHIQGTHLMGKPVYSLDNLPDNVDTVVFAVNPAKAHHIMAETKHKLKKFIKCERLI